MTDKKVPAKLSIAVLGNEANVTNRVGSNVYAFELLKAIEKKTRKDSNIEWTILLSQQPIPDWPEARKGWRYKVVTPKFLWTQWALPLELFRHKTKYNVVYSPGHYLPRHSPIPSVCTIMDTAYLTYPQFFKKKDLWQLTEWTKQSIATANHIIAISNATKRSVATNYNKTSREITTIYPAMEVPATSSLPNPSQVLSKFSIKKPFILFVGTIQPRKNLQVLVEAFEICHRMLSARSLQKKKSKTSSDVALPQLVLAGKVGWLASDTLERIEKSSAKEAITLTGFISDEEKAVLYQESACSVLIGLEEGFGIPPLEALHFGTIPVVSKGGSLQEVVGDAGISVTPTNPQSVADGLFTALTMTVANKTKFKKKSKQQIKKFSWQSSASQLIAALQKVAEQSYD